MKFSYLSYSFVWNNIYQEAVVTELLEEVSASKIHDELCDQMSDALLDAHLRIDPDAKVACGLLALEQQCKEIMQAVSHGKTDDDTGTREQGLMLGYATAETEGCMPSAVLLTHKLIASIRALERNGTWPWVRPDGKTQLSYAVSHRFAISMFHYGTLDGTEEELLEIVHKNFDLCLGAIIRTLDLTIA